MLPWTSCHSAPEGSAGTARGPGSVVAELCPLGYCTDSFRTLAPRLGLAYLRWTNAIASNAFANYDTVVEPHAFIELMRRALALADW